MPLGTLFQRSLGFREPYNGRVPDRRNISQIKEGCLSNKLETNYCAIRVHLAEILPLNRRGRILSLCDLCWSIGYVFVSLMGLFLKDPLVGETKAVDMQLSYWRMLFAIAGGLNITLSCATALLEESPRYFLHIRKNYLALLTLKQFYAINKSSYGDTMQVGANFRFYHLKIEECIVAFTKIEHVEELIR
ncbi:hypothetical protein NQ315_002734 [Exocentrus adspersus]|uniref:Uncharacterized protein n=1 Tax=Exocentrus adspersus TaxID=1586481 RepID=A0AAV8V988_9CUCU|nr:hypothetical protein NQ315_002734 [Exocentrus adspersus]